MRTVLAVALVVALSLPAAQAGWSGAGNAEPDTREDREEGRMWPDPDTLGQRKVYFSGYAAVPPTSFHPNVGALGTRIPVAPVSHHQALLGVWLDCDRDGYMGRAEGALREYRAALLPADHVCPIGPHNDGLWVAELLMLGGPDPCERKDAAYRAARCTNPREGPGVDPVFVPNPHVLYAQGVRVWADVGGPGDTAGSPCAITPQPRGTTAGTGYLAAAADCHAQTLAGRSVVATIDTALATADPDDATGLRFGDASRPWASPSRLNVHFPVNLYGNPQTGKSGLLEQDAAEGPALVVDCDTGSARLADPTASWWDAAAGAYDAALGDCDPRTQNRVDDTHGALALERDLPSRGAKARASLYFVFNDGSRGSGNDALDAVLGRNAPQDGGVGYDRSLNNPADPTNHGGPSWDAHTRSVSDPRIVREDLAPAPPPRITYYASIPALAQSDHHLKLPSADPLTYGEPACSFIIGEGVPDRNGWVCDPTRWYRTDTGEDAMPYTAEGPQGGERLAPRVGDRYHLLDVDCYDGQVTQGIHAGYALVDGGCD